MNIPFRLLRLARGLLAAGAAFATLSGPLAQVSAPPAPRFEIRRFVIEGNTLLPQAEVDRLVGPHTGPNRDFGDVQRALEGLQEAYSARGYTTVRVLVPEQEMRAGDVRLQVIEAGVRNIRIEGNKFFDSANIRAGLPGIVPGRVPDTDRVGQQIQLGNENPAKQLSLALEATDDGTQVDAIVKVVDEKPWRANLSFDNTGNSSTGYFRTGVGFQHANLFNADHILTAQYITSPTKIRDVTIVGLGYRVPLYRRNATLDVIAGYSDVDSGTVQNLFTVSGSGTILGLRYTQILPRLDVWDQRLAFGWDYRDIKSHVQFIGFTGSIVPDIKVQPVSVNYTVRRSVPGSDLSLYAGYFHNMPGGPDGDQGAFDAQRQGASKNFGYYRYGGAYTSALPGDMLLRAVASAQYTNDLLVSSEQFGMGGADSVRGFFERETGNDVGHRGSVEVYSPDFGGSVGENWRSRALVFVDVARGYDRTPARSPVSGLASFGFGVRMNQGKSVAVRLDWARVIDAAGTRPEGKDRLHLAVSYSF